MEIRALDSGRGRAAACRVAFALRRPEPSRALRGDPPPAGPDGRARRFRSAWLPYALVAPQIAITLVFFFLPAGVAVYRSLHIQDAFGGNLEFVGLDNFRDPLQRRAVPQFVQGHGALLRAGRGLGIVISLILAVFADRIIHGAGVYKTLLIWPYAVAPAIAGVLWMFLFNPTLGIVAHWLQSAGIDWNYLLYGNQAMLLVVIAAVWKQVSYNFLFFLAGLQSIPKSMIEAAAIDGAGPVKRFVTIVFPLLSPTTFFLLVVNIVFAFFDTFGIIDAVTSGGPGQATEILVFKVFKDGFKSLDIGGSAAQSVVLMVIVITLTVIQFRYVERKVQY